MPVLIISGMKKEEILNEISDWDKEITYIHKPFDPDDLLLTINELLEVNA